jgi:DNA (cytosine-5)-methyltransferase 1
MTSRQTRRTPTPRISAVDLFCGAGGLTFGLSRSGVRVEAGIDVDPLAGHAYSANNQDSKFLERDLSTAAASEIGKLFGSGYRLLAGCAPCQPFSKLTNGRGRHRSWNLLDTFGRLVSQIRPEFVTMENVPELAARGNRVFERFLAVLRRCGYWSDWDIVNCRDYGAPQSRKRLVLLASRLGQISIPRGRYTTPGRWKTVRDAIGRLPRVKSGETHPKDRLHVAALLSSRNLERVRATPRNGGTKQAWPRHLLLECQLRETGARYHSVYGRMAWDSPAPTMTTLCNGIGNGRFGHPEQDRAITLREAAILQSFPRWYEFWPKGERVHTKAVARLIGNAVPPALGLALGRELVAHAAGHRAATRAGQQ